MKKIVLISLMSIFLFNCKKNQTQHYDYSGNDKSLLGLLNLSEEITTGVYSYSPDQEVSANSNQKIIKTSNLKFETSSVEKTYTQIKKYVESNKGLIQNDNTHKSYNQIQRSLIIRIPTKKFQYLIDSISNKVTVFDYKNISLKDVTEEFIDLEARLKAKKALENRYLQLLIKAKNVKEMLEIEREIANIREEIEAKQGRLNYLQDQVSFSTINVEFYETVEVVKSKSKTYFSQVVKAIKGGFIGLGDFILGILYLWPLVLVAIPLFLFARKKIKKKK